jgi:cellulose synthase/poly-beta-1,6-N-acetylglucosamine synthase-like glycosyltransferase
MKGPFSFWTFFGITMWIDIISTIFFRKGTKSRVNPYMPLRSLTVIIPAHKEEKNIIPTIDSIYKEKFPVKNVIVCGDSVSKSTGKIVHDMAKKYHNLIYIECPENSKAQKINHVVATRKDLGDFIYVRDARVVGEVDCIEKMMGYFTGPKVAAVTSYGRLGTPTNFLSRSYFYGKSWINEVGRFRKGAQEKRKAIFVICGASTIYRKEVLSKIPIPHISQTEDTYYTWLLQRKGYAIRVADDATVSAPDVDGPKFSGITSQLKQSYRWSSGTMQCFYLEADIFEKNKRLFLTTILPGFLEALGYSIALLLLPLVFFISRPVFIGFLIGDAFLSLLGTAVFLPKKFFKTLIHYPQIFFFKYLNAMVFLASLAVVTVQALDRKKKWSNEWSPPPTDADIGVDI